MDKKISLLAVLLLSAPCARAADDIVPMLARDPSALVLAPSDLGSGALKVSAPPPAVSAYAPAADAKVKVEAADSAALHAQYRAVSLPISQDQLIGIKPGDRVDVLAVFDVAAAKEPKKMLAATVLQNVAVLGIATDGGLFGKGVVTLELNPVEAQYAVLVERRADLYLAKRAPGDTALHPMQMSDFGGFFR
ncbi:MAG: hypothetical protein KGI84_08585 [Elusimicrobia bacterium]|nr:hypothetical protein [Elusimicrobiota bacterium]